MKIKGAEFTDEAKEALQRKLEWNQRRGTTITVIDRYITRPERVGYYRGGQLTYERVKVIRNGIVQTWWFDTYYHKWRHSGYSRRVG